MGASLSGISAFIEVRLLNPSKITRRYDCTRGSVGRVITRLSMPIYGERITRAVN